MMEKTVISRRKLFKWVSLIGLSGAAISTQKVSAEQTSAGSVEAFGAIGDGKHNDTKALQRAFDQLHEVHLSPGKTYLVDSLTIPPVKNWKLCGHGASIKKYSSLEKSHLICSAGHINNAQHAQPPIQITDTTFDGDQQCNNVLLLQSWNSEINNCEIKNSLNNGLVFTSNNKKKAEIDSSLVNNRILNCRIHHNDGHGIYIKDTSRRKATDGLLSDSYIYDNGGFGVRISAAAGWNLNNLNIYANGGGVKMDSAGKGTRLSHCFIDPGKPHRDKPETYYAVLVKNHFKTAFLSLDNNHFGAAVASIPKGNKQKHGISSNNNNYFGDGHLLHPKKSSSGVSLSTNDHFESKEPLRWLFAESNSTFIVNNSYDQSTLALYSGVYRAEKSAKRSS